jgi:hypothetical protein
MFVQHQIIAEGNIVTSSAGRPSTILTTLQAYGSTFHDLWSNYIMVHNDMLSSPPQRIIFDRRILLPEQLNPPALLIVSLSTKVWIPEVMGSSPHQSQICTLDSSSRWDIKLGYKHLATSQMPMPLER